MNAMPTVMGQFPVPRLATAEPGHWPDIPHPIPNIAAPIIVFLVSTLIRGLKVPPSTGGFHEFRHGINRKEGDDRCAAHDKDEAEIIQPEETEDNLRLGHATVGEPKAKEDPSRVDREVPGVHYRTPMSSRRWAVMMPNPRKVMTA